MLESINKGLSIQSKHPEVIEGVYQKARKISNPVQAYNYAGWLYYLEQGMKIIDMKNRPLERENIIRCRKSTYYIDKENILNFCYGISIENISYEDYRKKYQIQKDMLDIKGVDVLFDAIEKYECINYRRYQNTGVPCVIFNLSTLDVIVYRQGLPLNIYNIGVTKGIIKIGNIQLILDIKEIPISMYILT